MLVEIECGVDVVGGIFFIVLKGVGLLLYICVIVKLLMIVMKCMLQQFLGGVLFIISGVCGMFCIDVLCKFGFLDCIKVEDFDFIWILVVNGYCIRQVNCCIVYLQECNSLCEEWCCWWCWIVGYVVCMCLYKRFLFSCFGIFSIFFMLLVVFYGVGIYFIIWFNEFIIIGLYGVVLVMFLFIWVGVVCVIGVFSVWFYCCWLLVFLVLFFVVYVLLVYVIWIIYGFIVFFIGCEFQCDKFICYFVLVEVLIVYF